MVYVLYTITDDELFITSNLASFPIIGAVLGSLLINKPMEYYGRKMALIGHYLIVSFGFMLIAFTHFTKMKSML